MEESAIKNIVQKVIRSIELNGDTSSNIIKYIENDKNVAKYKHNVNDSELLRILECIDALNVFKEKDMTYLSGIISVKIGYNISKYNTIKENGGILILEHYRWTNDNEGKQDENGKPLPFKPKLTQVYEDKENKVPLRESFCRLIVGSGHNRAKKALFVREDLLDRMKKILLGGIDEYSETNKYPLFEKGYAKWSSYYGLASTDSKPVSYVPKIVIVDDFERTTMDTFDIVTQERSLNPSWIQGENEKSKYVKQYSVKEKVQKSVKILPFDGAGIVSVECAKKWAEELEIKNKYGNPYIPAAYQIRAIPGFKGNLYTFDIDSFAKENGYIITDIKNTEHDLRKESVDIIMTKSQTKFIGLFSNDIETWREVFDKEIIFYKKGSDGKDTEEIGCSYKRTFNISEYSEDSCDVKKRMITSYQHLQTIDFTDDEMKGFSRDTTEMLEKINMDVNEFLKFRSCIEEKEKNKGEWKRLPSYYRAAYYASEANKPVIFADDYFKRKVAEDIEGIKNKVLSGKCYIMGNYQVLTPDIYGLAQYAFGKRGDGVTGLLKSKEIYSNWWLSQKECDCRQLALIRNPHIYMEARIADMVSDNAEDHIRYLKIKKWYEYQTTGIITDSYSTIPLALGTADFDGDHIATTNCEEYINAVRRAIDEEDGNTIIFEKSDNKTIADITEEVSSTQEYTTKTETTPNINDISKLMNFDILAFQNNIGSVIDKVTTLWGIEQDVDNKQKIRKYIKIMDIVGQLTIDAVKSGEFEEIPEDITGFLKHNNVMRPYFMKYLPKNKKKRKAERDAVKNAEMFFGDDKELSKRQEKFSDTNTNVNKLCHYMEQQINGLEIRIANENNQDETFLEIFMEANICKTSELYIKIWKRLVKLVKEHNILYSAFVEGDGSMEEREEKLSHYRYFYIYARNKLLELCKLSKEKSLNKVLNCIVYACYNEKNLLGNDSAKNILWNSFGNEMVKRAKGDYTDRDMVFSKVAKAVKRGGELKRKKYSRYLDEKSIFIRELEEAKNLIIVTEADISYIKDMLSDKRISELWIPKKRKDELLKLYAVLFVVSKRKEYDAFRTSYKKEEVNGEIVKIPIFKSFRYKPLIRINEGGNNRLNYSNIAKLCGFTEYQRKRTKELLKYLNELGAIEIDKNHMEKLRFYVTYEMIHPVSEAESIVSKDNYVDACKQITELVLKNEEIVAV